MSLNKTSNASSNHDVVQLVAPEGAEDVQMSISLEGMGHILARLTDLYSNPIEAAAREVISNAIDATVLLPEGERRPVEITLPSALQSLFIVRDHGVGMSEATVRDIYSQYGASTKRTDMRQIGAYGLGAKAPLAYCTEFSVSTTRDGLTTTFTVSRTHEGNFVKVHPAEETGAPNGTTVTIPVKGSDVAAFHKAIETYRKFSFDVPVKVDGNEAAASDFVLVNPALTLDEDEEAGIVTTGRVWVRRDALTEFFTHKFSNRYYDSFPYSYVLSGWAYRPATDRGYYRNEPKLMVELKPGVVDFSSSRDEITNNDRSARLDTTVGTFIKSADKASVQDLLAVYRTFPRPDAEKFFAAVFSQGKVKGKTLVLAPSRGAEFALTVEDFITDEGFSPLAPYVASYPKTVLSAFVLAPEARNLTVLDADTVSEDLFGLKSQAFVHASVSTANELVLEAVQSGKPAVSLAELFLIHHMQATLRRSTPAIAQIVVVQDGDADSVKRMLAFRKLFSENDFASTAFVLAKPGKALDRQIEVLRDATSTPITVTPIQALLARGKDLRKENRVAAPRAADEPMRVRVLTDAGLDNESEIIKTMRNRYLEFREVTTEDLIKTNALLVLTKGQAAAALIGAANDGVKIVNRPIYAIENNRGLKAAHYKALVSYKGLVASPDFSYKSKEAEKIAERATYSGRLLKSQLKEADTEDIVRSLVMGLYIPQTFYKRMATFVADQCPEDRVALKILKLAGKVDRYGGTRFGSLTDTEVLLSSSKGEGEFMVRLRRTIQLVNQEADFDAALLAKLMAYQGTVEGPLADQLFAAFYAKVQAASLSNEAA